MEEEITIVQAVVSMPLALCYRLNLYISKDMDRIEELRLKIEELRSSDCETEWDHELLMEQIEELELELFLIENA